MHIFFALFLFFSVVWGKKKNIYVLPVLLPLKSSGIDFYDASADF